MKSVVLSDNRNTFEIKLCVPRGNLTQLAFTATQTILPSCSRPKNFISSCPSSLDEYVSNALTAIREPVVWLKTTTIIPRTFLSLISDTLRVQSKNSVSFKVNHRAELKKYISGCLASVQ